jgi:hypothetical protein
MVYLITKMLLCLLLAALLGLLIGWQLRTLVLGNRNRSLQMAIDDCHAQLRLIERERDELYLRAEQLEAANSDLNARLMDGSGVTAPPEPSDDLGPILRRLQALEQTNRQLQSRIDSIDFRAGGHPLAELGNLSSEQTEMFRRLGIETTIQLLNQYGSSEGKTALLAQTGMNEEELTRLAEVADLLRIPGVSGPIANLLQASGIHSVADMAGKQAYRLALKLKRINAEKQLLSTAPGASIISLWINTATTMERKLSAD